MCVWRCVVDDSQVNPVTLFCGCLKHILRWVEINLSQSSVLYCMCVFRHQFFQVVNSKKTWTQCDLTWGGAVCVWQLMLGRRPHPNTGRLSPYSAHTTVSAECRLRERGWRKIWFDAACVCHIFYSNPITSVMNPAPGLFGTTEPIPFFILYQTCALPSRC